MFGHEIRIGVQYIFTTRGGDFLIERGRARRASPAANQRFAVSLPAFMFPPELNFSFRARSRLLGSRSLDDCSPQSDIRITATRI